MLTPTRSVAQFSQSPRALLTSPATEAHCEQVIGSLRRMICPFALNMSEEAILARVTDSRQWAPQGGAGPAGTGAPRLSGAIEALAPCERSHWATVADVLLPRGMAHRVHSFWSYARERRCFRIASCQTGWPCLSPSLSRAVLSAWLLPLGLLHIRSSPCSRKGRRRGRGRLLPEGFGKPPARTTIRLTTQTKLPPDCASS
jgi:hypothetical protein